MKKEAVTGFFFVLHWTQSVAEAGQGNPESNGHKAASSERGSSYAAGQWTQDQLPVVCDSEIGNLTFLVDLFQGVSDRRHSDLSALHRMQGGGDRMRRYWQYKQRWRKISGLPAVAAAGVLIGAAALPWCGNGRGEPEAGLQLPGPSRIMRQWHRSPSTIRLSPPTSGKITSGFGYRLHPVTGERDFHTGIDIAAAEGTPVVAALPGTVTEVGYDGIYGNYVRMSHGTNIETRYCHCSEILVEEGSQLREGERIALSGSTGMTTGAHLHFEVLADGLLADPGICPGGASRCLNCTSDSCASALGSPFSSCWQWYAVGRLVPCCCSPFWQSCCMR